MPIIDCLIVDDDVQASNALQHDVMHYCTNLQIVGIAYSVADAVRKIDALKPNLVLLDIKLGDGSGFDVLAQSSFKNYKVIFVTAYDEYAIKAFKVSAMDYLLKPIDSETLQLAIAKVKDIIQIEAAYKNVDNGTNKILANRISFNTADGISIHNIDSIIYCEASRNYCSIYFIEGEKLFTAKTLLEIETMLHQFGFERIHQSYLINVSHLKKYSNKEGGHVMMSNGKQLPVSRRKKADLLMLLEKTTA